MTSVGRIAPGVEVQVVDAADSAAYDTHDADDALVLGLLTLEDLDPIPLWAEATRRVRGKFTSLDRNELRRAVVHELVDWQVRDLLETTREQIAARIIETVEQVRAAPPIATE